MTKVLGRLDKLGIFIIIYSYPSIQALYNNYLNIYHMKLFIYTQVLV